MLMSFCESREVAEPSAETEFVAQASHFGALAKRSERDHVRIANNLADDESAAGTQHAVKLTQGRVLVGNLAEHCDKINQIEVPVGIGQRAGVSLAQLDVVDAELVSAAGGVINHLWLNVDRMDSATRASRTRPL
jgi:hypothetical protein